jgi:hypothetical protein
MYKKIDFTQLEGFPLTQDTLAELQKSYRDTFGGLAFFLGDYVIVSGVADLGASYGDGWVAINGELLPFVGGVKAAQIIIEETVVSKQFADANSKPVWYTRVAKCGVAGGTTVATFVRLSSIKQIMANLAAEITNRTNAVTTEAASRAAADAALQTNITNEASLRAAIDSAIDNARIAGDSNEAAARAAADTAEAAARAAADTSEGNTRAAADTAEAAARAAADAAILGLFSWGTYTPAITNQINVNSSAGGVCQWIRVGNVVTVSGKVAIDHSSVSLFRIGVSLPIASAIDYIGQLAGAVSAMIVGGASSGVVRADVANDRAEMTCFPFDNTDTDWFFTFTYLIV